MSGVSIATRGKIVSGVSQYKKRGVHIATNGRLSNGIPNTMRAHYDLTTKCIRSILFVCKAGYYAPIYQNPLGEADE